MKELDLFFQHLEKDRDLTPASLQNYRTNLGMFFDWLHQTPGQTNGAVSVTPLDVKAYREYLKRQDYKPSTINKKLVHLSIFFQWCAANGFTDGDPTARVKGVKEVPKAPKWLTKQEQYKVLRAAEQSVQLARVNGLRPTEWVATRTEAIVKLILNTGLRVSELCDLLKTDVRLSERKGLLVVRWGKGSKYRQVPMNPDARRSISEWLAARGNGACPYLFHTGRARMSRQLVQWHLDQLGKRAGVELGPHVLRHTFGKNLADQGVPLDRIAMLMGHSDINTTAVYTMPGPDDLEQAVNQIAWED